MEITKKQIEKVKRYLTIRKEKWVIQADMINKLDLTGSQVRLIISELRYTMPIINKAPRMYLYTTKQRELIAKYIKKLDNQIKEKTIKKNVIKKYL